MKQSIGIDVIIPVYKPDKKLERLLGMLACQNLPVQRIILMNTGERTFPKRLLGLHPGIEFHQLDKKEFDHGGTRHRAAQYSSAEYLLYMTQDAVPKDEYLTGHLAEAFSEPGVKAAYARQLPADGCSELERYARKFNYPPKGRIKTKKDLAQMGIKAFFCSNVCAMYEKKTYEELGGFVRHTIFNEDMIYAGGLIKAGYAIAYAAEAQVIHSHNYTGRQQFHRNFDLAVSQAEHPEIFGGISSEDEGIRMVLKTAGHCIRTGKPWLIFPLVLQSGCKYMGYRLGKNYRRLPKAVILRCTANRSYWEE